MDETVKFMKREQFFSACWNGNTEVVRNLLENDPHLVFDSPQDVALFRIACENGHTEIVKLLLNDERIDVNHIDIDCYWTVFHIVCHKGYIEIVKLLLNDKRVEINEVEEFGRTPFSLACEGQIEVVELLLSDMREWISIDQITVVQHLFLLLVKMDLLKL